MPADMDNKALLEAIDKISEKLGGPTKPTTIGTTPAARTNSSEVVSDRMREEAESDRETPDYMKGVSRTVQNQEAARQQRPEAAYNKDLAQKSGVYQNINGMDTRQTRRLSRMADALNNRVYWKPGQTGGGIAAVHGGNMFMRPTPGEQYQMPRIETEETRQMETQRDISAQGKRNEQEVQQGYNRRDLDRGNKQFDEMLRRSAGLSDDQRARWMNIFNTGMERETQDWLLWLSQYTINVAKAEAMIELSTLNPTLAAAIAQIFGGQSPSPEEILQGNWTAQWFRSNPKGSMQQLSRDATNNGINIAGAQLRTLADAARKQTR